MGTTPNYALPFPDGSDPPCEGAEQIEALAEAYTAAADLLLEDERDLVFPFGCKVSWLAGTPVSIIPGGNMLYDTVERDDGGFTDLGPFPDRIFFPVDGVYVIGTSASLTTHLADGIVFLGISDQLWPWEDQAANYQAYGVSYHKAVAGTSMSATLTDLSGANTIYTAASLWAFLTYRS